MDPGPRRARSEALRTGDPSLFVATRSMPRSFAALMMVCLMYSAKGKMNSGLIGYLPLGPRSRRSSATTMALKVGLLR